jgi:hypothetical protein
MNHAQTLRTIAGLIEDGCPPPLGINLSKYDGPTGVQVDDEDLTAWLTALDLVEPTWDVDADSGYSRAGWPAGSFDNLPFSLICVAVVEQVSS